MARSYRLTCLKTEGENLSKLGLPCLTFKRFLPMIRSSDRPKTYWGHYQDYSSIDLWQKIPKKIIFIFHKIRWPAIWTEKLGKMRVTGDVEILA